MFVWVDKKPLSSIEICVMKTFPFTSELGWSVSRFEIYHTCKRKYFYRYYDKYDQEFDIKRIARLKSMTTIPLEIGNIVHDVVESILHRLQKSSSPVQMEKLEQFVFARTQEYVSSKEFSEIHYKELETIDAQDLGQRAFQSVKNIVTSDRFEWIRNLPQSSKDRWIIEPPGYGETRIENIKAYCKVDFMLPHERVIYILDWKTGKQDLVKHRKQLIGYALFARYHFNHDFDEVIPIVCYVRDGFEEVRPEITTEDITDFIDTMKTETLELKSLNQDVFKNTPKPKEEFTCTENLHACRFCEFRELCQR
jgi:hypothetical protein